MALAERCGEIEVLERLLRESGRGTGRLVLVTGPVASGKTTLCRAAADAAAARGHRVLNAVATHDARSSPFGVADQLARAAGLAPPDPARPTADEHERLGAGLHELSGLRPLLIVVDGLHHSDVESLRWLLHAASRIRDSPVALVLNEVSGALHTHDPTQVELRVALRRHPDCHRLRLRPLSADGVGELLRTALDDPSPALVRHTHTVSGGNPLLLRSLVEDTLVGDLGSDRPHELVAGEAFRDNVQACLHSGPPEMLAVARALAVLRAETTADVIGELVELEPEVTASALSCLDASGLTDGRRFRHPATAEVVLRSTDRRSRLEMRQRAVHLLLDRGAPTDVIAPLLRETGIRTTWAVSVLRDAAEQARVEGRTGTAVGYLNHAIDIARDDARPRLRMMVLRIHWQTDPSVGRHHLAEVARAAVEHALDPVAVARLVRYLAWNGRFDELHEVLDAVNGADGRYAVSAVDDVRGWLACTFPGSAFGEVAGNPPGAAAETPGRLLCDVLRDGPSDDRARRAAQILSGAAPPTTAEPEDAFVHAAAALLYCGEPEASVEACTRLLRERRGVSTRFGRIRLRAVLAEATGRCGDPSRAADLARSALADASTAAWSHAIALPRATLLRAATELGDHDTAESLLRGHEATHTPNRIELLFRHAHGHYLLAVGRPATAAEMFRACGSQMAAWRCDRPEFLPWRGSLAEARLAQGDRDAAAELAGRQLQMLARPGTTVHAHTCRLLARARDCGGREDRDGTAALVPRRGPAAPEVIGAPPVHGGLPAGPGALSDAELRVASLAASGCTNREISRRLFVTVSTVEQHLTRIYRKLDVRRRSDLPRELVTVADAPPGEAGQHEVPTSG